MANPDLQALVDTLVIETLLADPAMVKVAEEGGLASTIAGAVTGYVGSKIDSDNKVASVLAILTPGILSSLGLPVLGFLVWLAKVVFRIDLAGIFSSIGSEIGSLLSGAGKTTSAAVEGIVAKAVMGGAGGEPTEADLVRVQGLSEPNGGDANKAAFTLAEAKLFSYALNDFVKKNPNLDIANMPMTATAAGGLFGSKLAGFITGKHKFLKLFIFVLGWIVKVVVASAGFMIAEDAINGVLGRKSTVDKGEAGTAPAGKEDVSTVGLDSSSTQTKYKVSPSYPQEMLNNKYNRWIVQAPSANIGVSVTQWATDVYPALKGHEAEIEATRGYKEVVQRIKNFNKGVASGLTFIPRNFTSRKELVDTFIDEVAEHAGSAPASLPGKKPDLAI